MRSYLTKCEHFPKPQLLTLQFHLEGDCREPRGSLQLSRLNSGGDIVIIKKRLEMSYSKIVHKNKRLFMNLKADIKK